MKLVKLNKYILADFALLFCALVWGVSFVTMKILVNIYSSCWLLFMRFLASSILIAIIFKARVIRNFHNCFKGGIILGIALFLAITSQTVALNYIDAGRQAFITSTYVLFVPLLLWILKRIFPGVFTILASILCVIGMHFLTGGLNGNINTGDILTLLCAVFYACQILAAWRYASFQDPITLSMISFFVVSILALISSFIFEFPLRAVFDFSSALEFLFTVLFVTIGGFMVQVCAQKYAKPSHASIIMSLESVFGLLAGIILLGETVTKQAALGCVLIFISVISSELQSVFSQKQE